jgi:hypothetical protein
MNRTGHFIPQKSLVFQRLATFEHHFVGVNKMVPAAHSERCPGINAEARELEERIAENVVELLETA